MSRYTPPTSREIGVRRVQSITKMTALTCVLSTAGLVGFVAHEYGGATTNAGAATTPVAGSSGSSPIGSSPSGVTPTTTPQQSGATSSPGGTSSSSGASSSSAPSATPSAPAPVVTTPPVYVPTTAPPTTKPQCYSTGSRPC